MKQVKFNGKGDEYFKIWIVNILLSIITLGLYYPWAKVRTRRYFYANTEYEGRYFDYHATGNQLFVGYCIGVSLLFALNFVSTIIPEAAIVAPIVMFAILPWLIWRSLSFNRRMTSFSNVRFSFKGELKTAYYIYMLIPVIGYVAIFLIALATIGGTKLPTDFLYSTAGTILIPLLGVIANIVAIILAIYIYGIYKKKGANYQIGKTKFGQGNFIIDVTAGKFISIALKASLLFMAFFTIFIIVLFVIYLALIGSQIDAISIYNALSSPIVETFKGLAVIAMYFFFIVSSVFIGAYYYSRQRNYLYQSTTLDNKITFKSTVKAKGYFFVLFTNFLLTLLTFGFAMPWAQVRKARYLAQNTWIDVSDIDINSYLTQKEAEQSAIGEEIGDVFDIDVDFGF